jgi:putative hemolysin
MFDVESPVVQITDGAMLIDASISLEDLREDYHVMLPEPPEYETLGGLLLTTLQKIPQAEDAAFLDGKRISIVEMGGSRLHSIGGL